METEQAKTMENTRNIQMVTYVGNEWLMSRSKSHSGRIYYFNTVTGEAVWNLSNEEREKAKALLGKVPSQPGTYPEPKGPPEDHDTSSFEPNNEQNTQVTKYTTPKVYNKQIINNQFTRGSYTPFMPYCNPMPMNSMQNVVSGTPQQPFNAVWINPPPIFLTSPSTSTHNINQTEDTGQQEFNFSRRKNLKNYPQGNNKFSKSRLHKFKTRKQSFVPRKIETPMNIGDLRAKLSAKTKKSVPNEIPNETQKKNEDKTQEYENAPHRTHGSQTSNVESSKMKSDLHAIGDDEWLKIHGSIEGAKLKLDTSDLKNVATNNLECECWYIVADRNIILHHFNFLNVLATSDEQCKLMVVRDVMSGLQAAARADAAKDGARKVLRGLSQMFAAKLAVIGEYTFTPTEIKDCSGMINFCTKLLEQNEHVILLSNEEGLEKRTNVPTFSISEVKELLTRHTNKTFNPIIERNIKITIPNCIEYETNDMEISADATEPMSYDEEKITHEEHTTGYNETSSSIDHDETVPHNVETSIRNVDNIVDDMKITADKTASTDSSSNSQASEYISKKVSPNKKETNVQTDNFLYTAKMVDAEVQTEPRMEVFYPTVQKDSIGINTVENNMNAVRYLDRETSVDKSIGIEKAPIPNEESQTRGVRLKRSTSNQTVRSANENTHYKWHRKRRGDSLLSDSSLSLDRVIATGNANTESNALPQDLPCQSRCQSTQMCYEDVFEGSESSSCIFQNRPSSENIIIEESSTSDVISNSVSNENLNVINKSKERAEQSKNVMFEITSKAMELNLKTRCDEWLAQFNQIMEEALGQVLVRASQHVAAAMPPPWTLHEATQCVRRTYSADADVADAATKLSQVIYRMSDARGKIIVQFNPNDFMELYSYGVYLIDALQSIMENFEDLQIAAESLAKLLSDIENPIEESGHNNSLDDVTDISVVISQSSVEGPLTKDSLSVSNKSTHTHSVLSKCTPSDKQGGLHKSSPTGKQGGLHISTLTGKQDDSHKSTPPGKQGGLHKSTPTGNQDDLHKSSPTGKQGGLNKTIPTTPQKAANISDGDSNKSSGKYNLRSASKKKINTNKMETSPVKFIRKVNIHDDFFTSLHLQRKEENIRIPTILQENVDANMADSEHKSTNKSLGADNPRSPNIIRNFTRCQEFEEKLKNQARKPLDMDMLDYSMCHDDECENMEESYSDDYEQNQEQFTQQRREEITENVADYSEDFNNNDFKMFVSTLVNHFRQTIACVQKFCDKVRGELESQSMQTGRKMEIRDKALLANSRIKSICESLRRVKECNVNQSRLKDAGFLLKEKEDLMYREVIDSCVGHGENMSETLNLVIDAVSI